MPPPFRREVHTANMQTGRGASSGKINATNVQSGALWRFSKPYMWDWRVGKIAHPTTELALAVGASSAFPPLLSPARLTLTDSDFVPATGFDLQKPAVHRKRVSDRWRRLRQPRPEDGVEGVRHGSRERWRLQDCRRSGTAHGLDPSRPPDQ